jgi:hypothetical protein
MPEFRVHLGAIRLSAVPQLLFKLSSSGRYPRANSPRTCILSFCMISTVNGDCFADLTMEER